MVITCPYCGEKNTPEGLRGHVIIGDDEEHGPLGEIPDGFEETEAGQAVVEFEGKRQKAFQQTSEEARQERESRAGLLARIFGGS